MKSITTKIVSLIIVMSFITTSVFAAASMSLDEFIQVLNGDYNDNQEYVTGNLPNAYRYVSTDQIKVMKEYQNNVAANFDTKINPDNYAFVPESLASKEEIADLVKSITLLMTFPTQNTANNVSSQVGAAGTEFYNSSFATLDKLSGNTLTKTALGKLLKDLRTSLRSEMSKEAASIYLQADGAKYITKIKEVIAKGLADTFTNADGQLLIVKNTMLNNQMLTMDNNAISTSSPFITLITKAFDMMYEIDGNYNTASIVANTIMVAALDLKVTVTKDSVDSVIYPNQSLPTTVDGSSLTIKISPETSIPNIDNISNWFDFSEKTSTYNAVNENSAIKITGTAAGSGVVKLYRNTDTTYTSDISTDKLMIELPIVIKAKATPKPTSGGGTSGGGTSGSHEIVVGPKVQASAPQVTTDSNGKIVISTSELNGVIYYTTDGSTPTTSSNIYTGPISYQEGMQIKAIVVIDGYAQSAAITYDPTPKLTNDHIAYVIGNEKNQFSADSPITRAEIATIFSRLLSNPTNVDKSYEAKYSDVFANDWYEEAIMHTSRAGLFSGDGNGLFRPNDNITRAEFATVASKFAGISSANPAAFNDVSGHWAEKYIAIVSQKGWVIGYEDGSFKPDASITRAEAVTIINRIIGRSADKAYIEANIKSLTTFPDLTSKHWAYYDILEAANQHDYSIVDGKETWK